MLRFLRRLPGRTVRAILALVLVAIVALVAVTRTQVGRDALARRLEFEFSRSFDGTLSIGTLTGNLMREFVATDITVRDSSGMETVHVDTLFVRTSWEDLVRRRVVIPRILVIRPRVESRMGQAGAARIPGFDRAGSPSDSSAGFLSFRSARVVVRDGTLHSRPVDSLRTTGLLGGFVADPGHVDIEHIALDALFDWDENRKQIDILESEAQLTRPAVSVRQFQSQVILEEGRVTVNRVRLTLDDTRIHAEATIHTGATAGLAYNVSVDAAAVRFDELRALLPGLPLSGDGAFRLDVSGSENGMAVSRAEFSSMDSYLLASGTAVGFPDSVDFDLAVERLDVRSTDLRALLPDFEAVAHTRFDSARASGFASGVAWLNGSSVDSLTADGALTLDGDPGSLTATMSIDSRDQDRPMLSIDADFAGLDLGSVTDLESTRLTGRLELAAQGLQPRTATGDARLELRGSRVGMRRVHAAVLQASAAGTALRFGLDLETAETGWLRADGLWTRDSLGTLSADAAWSGFDAGPLLGSDSVRTSASGRLGALFAGTDEASFAGDLRVQIDSTTIESGARLSRVPPQQVHLVVSPAGSAGPRVRIEGDALDAHLGGDVRFPAAVSAVSFWAEAFAGAVRRELDKPYPGTAPSATTDLLENARDIRVTVLRGEAASRLSALDLGRPMELRLGVSVRRPDLITAWWPGTPDIGGDLQFFADLQLDEDRMLAGLSLSGAEVRIDTLRLVRPEAAITVRSRFDGLPERSLVVESRLRADTLFTGPAVLPHIDATLNVENSIAILDLEAGRHAEIGPVRLAADLTSLPDRNRLIVREATVSARNYAWSLSDVPTIDIYDGGLTIDGMRIVSDYQALYGSQSITVRGALSDQVGDTLFVDADGVRLEEVTSFADLNPRLGGRLDGRLAYTRSGDRPLFVGRAGATGLVLDGRLIGHLDLQSSIVPGSPDVAVRMELTPADTAGARWPEPPFEMRRNALSMAGTIRLPATGDPGAWNLEVQVGRADLFFLKYIFNETLEDVAGYLEGGGTVTGTFRRPVIETEFEAHGGTFYIPDTGGRYMLEGPLGIGRDAVLLHRVTISDPGGGRAVVSGNLFFNEYQYFSFGLEAQLSNLLIINTGYTDELPFYGTIRGTGTATLTGPLASAQLYIPDGVTRSDSEIFIPIVESSSETDESFIVFADSTGRLPDLRQLSRRPFLLARRATVERRFLDGLDMDINLMAPRGSVIHLVIDPLLGDVINAESTGTVQIRREQGEFEIFGTLEVEGGDYLFTAGEVFVRRFIIEEGGTITWDSDPIDALLDIPAVYRTRASWAGLDLGGASSSALIPLVVDLQITGRVLSPAVDLSLAIDRTNQNVLGDYQALEARLNNPERSAEYATSVLLTNSFQLTTERVGSGTGEQLAFNSVSQLVSAQLNRFLNAALPNVDVSFGLLGERASDLDITYGVALRLLDERLIIRGEGVYQGSRTDATDVATETIQGEVVVEVRLSPTVSVEVFFRREGDVFQSAELTNTTGAGLSYQTEFSTWRVLLHRLFGWLTPDRDEPDAADDPTALR